MTGRESDRRRAERHAETFPVSIRVAESLELVGQSVNYSSNGILLQAHGKIPVVVGIKGKDYRGFLIRAIPSTGPQLTAYAIELTETLETDADAPR